MPNRLNKLSQFWQELKRRRVVRVITVYSAAAFVILELVSIIVDPLKLPERTLLFVIVLLCVGFIIVVILSWIYDLTPDGVQKTGPVTAVHEGMAEKPGQLNAWKIATFLSLLVIVGLIIFHIISNNENREAIQGLEKSIAVLPFDNWNSDSEYYYLGDAITDEIILQLWQIDAFDRVLSRSSTMQFKTDRKTIPEIAEQLGVNYIIEGSIQRQEDKVSIRILVIRAKEEDPVWGQEYNGDWKDIHSFQDNIAQKVAEKLKVVLSPSQIETIEKIPTDNPEAYDYYLLAEQLRSQRTPESLFKAKSYFEKAIEADPGFVRAYTGLARCYGNLAFYASWRPEDAYPPALKLANQALELDSLFGEAYANIGSVDLFFNFDFTSAERNFQRALELDPNNLQGYKSLSELFFFMGRFSEAVEKDLHAMALDPIYPLEDGLYGVHLYFAQKKDSAISHLRKLSGQKKVINLYLGFIYLHEGEYENSIVEFEKTLSGFSPIAITQLGLAYSKSGAMNETQRMLEILETRAETEFIPFSMRGALLAELGRKEKALDYLRKGYIEREEYLLFILHIDTISFSNLRSDPEFIDIMEKVWPEIGKRGMHKQSN